MIPELLIRDCHRAGVSIRLEEGILMLRGNGAATQRNIMAPYKKEIAAYLAEKNRLQKEWAFRHYVTWFVREVTKRTGR